MYVLKAPEMSSGHWLLQTKQEFLQRLRLYETAIRKVSGSTLSIDISLEWHRNRAYLWK